MKNFDEIMKRAQQNGPKRIAVACAQDDDVLMSVDMANLAGIADATLVGNKEEIISICNKLNIDYNKYEIINESDNVEAAKIAAKLVSDKKADILMKGLVDTSIVLKAVLNKELSLRTGSPISHTGVFEIPGYDRLLFVTDAAMNISPDLTTKAAIIRNAVKLAQALEIEVPKVGVVCAKEKVDEKMPATLDAQALVEMNKSGEIKNCIVGGPFALDNAVNEEAAHHKGITDPIAGKCDILLMPDIEAGNVLYKSISYFSESKIAGIILGTSKPIVLTSRADSEETKMYSIALAVLYSNKF
ncbi:MAG: phosphate butyryltransferase [Proteocatella sp.]